MKNIYFIIAIIFLFGCKKEKIEPSEKVDLTGKLKCLILKDNYKQLFKYYDTTGELKNISSIIGTDTFVFYSFKRESKSVFVYPDTNRFNYFYKILMDNQDLKAGEFIYYRNGFILLSGRIESVNNLYCVINPCKPESDKIGSVIDVKFISNISRKRSELEQPVLV